MAVLLRLHGHRVETALSGSEALRAVQRSCPEVVVMDISMPQMDCYEVARRIRLMTLDRIILIALTANGFDEDRQRCYEAGFDRHLTKPASPVDLEGLIRDLVVLRKQRSDLPQDFSEEQIAGMRNSDRDCARISS